MAAGPSVLRKGNPEIIGATLTAHMLTAIAPEHELRGSPIEFVHVTRSLARARARELALRAGRAAPDVVPTDYTQAKREVTGESDPQRQDAIFEEISASES